MVAGKEGFSYRELMDGFWSPSLPLYQQLDTVYAIIIAIFSLIAYFRMSTWGGGGGGGG